MEVRFPQNLFFLLVLFNLLILSFYSKHMDKHDRPYKCLEDGCEKLPGFTYSGGLLRHEREVHHKHGGPKKHFMCPHANCKRASGKGFSRQENLNEHLRRVHTQGNASPTAAADIVSVDEDDEEMLSDQPVAGEKRKRDDDQQDEGDLQETLKARDQQIEGLHQQIRGQTIQIAAMMQTINSLQASLHSLEQLVETLQMQHGTETAMM